MPTDLGREYTAAWAGDPPSMLKTDIPTWHLWRQRNFSLIHRVYYDVTVGGPAITARILTDPFQRMRRRLLSKRVDAIVESASHTLLIEVAYRAGLRAIGQVQSYAYLWSEDPKIRKPVRKVIVCQSIDPDTVSSAASLGIEIHQVHEPGPEYPLPPGQELPPLY